MLGKVIRSRVFEKGLDGFSNVVEQGFGRAGLELLADFVLLGDEGKVVVAFERDGADSQIGPALL